MAELALLALLPWDVPAVLGNETPRLPAFELMDQFGTPFRAPDLSGGFVAVIGSDGAGRDQSRAWADVLQGWRSNGTAPASLKIVRVADLRGTPRPLEAFVSRGLRRQGRSSVLLDWEGVLAGALGFEAGRANVVVFDPGGEVLFQARGEVPAAEQVAEMEGALAEALDRGRDASRSAITRTCLRRN